MKFYRKNGCLVWEVADYTISATWSIPGYRFYWDRTEYDGVPLLSFGIGIARISIHG